MRNRKQKIIQSTNLIVEKRYLDEKFLMEDNQDNNLPEFQVTPADGIGKYKIKYTWKEKNVNLPIDVRGDEKFEDEKFESLTKIYANQTDAQVAVDDFIKMKSYLLKQK